MNVIVKAKVQTFFFASLTRDNYLLFFQKDVCHIGKNVKLKQEKMHNVLCIILSYFEFNHSLYYIESRFLTNLVINEHSVLTDYSFQIGQFNTQTNPAIIVKPPDYNEQKCPVR